MSNDFARYGRTIATAAFFVASFFLCAALAPAQEIVAGGQATFAAGISGAWDNPAAISPFVRVGLEPELSIFSDTAELRASGTVTRGFSEIYEPTEGSISTLSLRLFAADWLTVDLGLQGHAPGAALLFSPVNFLMPVVLDLGSGGELPSTTGTAPLVGATAYVGNGYFSAYLVPAPAVATLPDVAAGILNGVSLLSVLDDPDVGGPLVRSALLLGATQTVGDSWRRTSFAIEAGSVLGPVDLTALYYHGLDRIPTVIASVDLTTVPTGEFALTASLTEAIVDAFGLSAQTTAGPALFWFDGSFTVGRTFGTTNVMPPGTAGVYETETVVAPHGEVVAGALVRLVRPPLLIAAEYRHGFIGSDRDDIIRLDLPGTALLSFTGDFADGLLSTTVAGIFLIPDRSAVVIGSLVVSPSSELSAFVQAPVVIASDESFPGGMRSLLSVTAGLTYRF